MNQQKEYWCQRSQCKKLRAGRLDVRLSAMDDSWVIRPSSRTLFGHGWKSEDEEWEFEDGERKYMATQRDLIHDIIQVAPYPFITEAERARTSTRKVYFLQRVTLEETRPIQVSEDRPFRMWYPATTPTKISKALSPFPALTPSLISKSRAVADSINWSIVLPETDTVDEVKASPTIDTHPMLCDSYDCYCRPTDYACAHSFFMMRESRLRTDIRFGPAVRRRLYDYLRRNHKTCRNGSYKVDNLDYFARAEIATSESDVLMQCSVSVFYPDVNYERESSALRDVLVSKLNARPHIQHKMEIAVPKSPDAIAVGEGGLCEILFGERTHSILIDVSIDQDIREYVKWFFRQAIDAVRLTTTERLKLFKHLDRDKAEKFENAVRVYFKSWKECDDSLRNKDHRVARLFPRAFVIGKSDWNSTENATMTYRVKWFTSPSKKNGAVILEDARDQELAKRILIEHGYFAESKEKNDDTNTMINIGCIQESFQHDSLFEKYIRRVLEMNGVRVKRVYLHRSYKGMHDVNEKARTTVYRAIIECLIRNREWYDAYPSSVYEWKDLLNRNLPWSWRLLDKEKESENEEPASSQEAELVFKDVNCGLRMVNLLTFDGRELSLTNGYDAPQWLVMKPIYCIAIGVTKEVRVACDSFIRRLNDEESAVNELTYSLEIVDKTWTADYRASDDFDTSEGELSVQGWPREHVEEVAMRLISYFEGTYIDCSGELNGRLLYGHGANYVEFVRQKLRGKAVIDVDLLQERITVVGEEAELARKKLQYFAANRHAFVITQQIAIKPPRYLHFMRNALRYVVGTEKLSAICGGAQIRFIDMEQIEFHGTLQQYDLFMDYLEEVDRMLVTSSSKINTSLKPDCPICLSPVSNAFYCLDCGHYYCLKCIIYQVKTLIRNRDLPLRCYHMDCGQLFSITDLKCLLLGDNRLPWLNAKKLHALVDSSIDYVLRRDRSLSRCPTPDCFGIFKNSEISQGQLIKCKSCKRSRCSSCMMEPHEGVSCEAYAILRSDEAASLQAYLLDQKGRVRECPTKGCGALIKKGEGCNHMHCTVCDTHFCWLCGFTNASQSRVYGHLREIHGAIGEEWPLFDYNVLRRNFGAAHFRNLDQLQLYNQQLVHELNELDVLIPLVEEP